MRRTRTLCAGTAVAAIVAAVGAAPAQATTDCSFTVSGATMTLEASCTTDETIVVPDGATLDGSGHTIAAVDPPTDHFRGAVVANGGGEAHVVDLTVTADSLANACDGGADRLRGIMLEGASGSISGSRVVGINHGPSGCQEGNAIEIRNAPFDGTHPATVSVEIAHNVVAGYQKTGIVANGDVDVSVHHNDVGSSATQENLAANGIQLGFGARGAVTHNHVDGNQWMGVTSWAATAVLLFDADAAHVSRNNIRGNSDIGVYIYGDGATAVNNRVFDEGADHPNSGYDIGLLSWGANDVVNNKVRGFRTPFYGVTDDSNKAIPSPM